MQNSDWLRARNCKPIKSPRDPNLTLMRKIGKERGNREDYITGI
uniref:Uncharacterized protein n=1 Tax=Anguilla anguilla TaxID=7936 RepID=A0A0E9U3L7_ANGAN